MSDEQDSGIKIVDKRRFSSSGESREGEEVEQQQAPSAEEPEPAQTASPDPSEKAAQEFPVEVDFSSFVVSLATQTMVMLGQMAHPESNEIINNFPAARQTIDIIAMLEEKTLGNLNPEEQKLISDILASLRMAYVQTVQK